MMPVPPNEKIDALSCLIDPDERNRETVADQIERLDEKTAKATLQKIWEVANGASTKFPEIQKGSNDDDTSAVLVNEVKNLAETIERSREEISTLSEQALSASTAKKEFLATLNHETRTPLNGIFGMVNFLIGTDLDSEQRGYMNRIIQSCNNMLQVVNDLMAISQMDGKSLSIRPHVFSISEKLKKFERFLVRGTSGKPVDFEIQVDERVPSFVRGDGYRVRQILANLISNAVKFTDKGSIRVSASVIGENSESPELEFVVKDTGIGIPEESLEMIFEPFVQIDDSITRGQDGIGIGLSISRNLVQLMNGEISVKSTPGIGSEFSFRCCFEVADEKPLLQIEEEVLEEAVVNKGSSDGQKTTNCNVLVVDDNPMNQIVIQGFLEKFGCTVTVAGNGQDALLAATQDEYFDLICMDVCMPEMDGLEATRRIRSSKSVNSKTQIVAVTGLATEDDLTRCLRAGMNDRITKPIDIEELKGFVEGAVELSS